jgi:hypothetical protein
VLDSAASTVEQCHAQGKSLTQMYGQTDKHFSTHQRPAEATIRSISNCSRTVQLAVGMRHAVDGCHSTSLLWDPASGVGKECTRGFSSTVSKITPNVSKFTPRLQSDCCYMLHTCRRTSPTASGDRKALLSTESQTSLWLMMVPLEST